MRQDATIPSMAARSARALWARQLGHVAAGREAVLPTVGKPRTQGDVNRQRRPFAGNILGIDPSLRGTGLAVVHFSARDERQLLASRTLKAPAKADLPACLALIADAVEELLSAHEIRHVALEQMIFVQNNRTALTLGAARGAAIAMAARRRYPVFEYPPTRIKQAVTGFGRASKEQIANQTRALLKLPEALPSDEADAAATALCHAFTWRDESPA